jgi:phosphoglycerol transferase MdoB-like AlkP superfamily enzyme
MRRHWLRPLWIVLALLFLLEAWLWDHLEPIVARIVDLIAWDKLKEKLTRTIEHLPPYAALAVFIVPFIVLLPLKFLEVYLLATRNWIGAILVLVLAKLLGLGVTAFVFDATRGKLLQMDWFRRMYDWFMWAREWAHEQTEPIRQRLQQMTWLLRPQRAGRFFRRLMRLRRRAYRGSAV